MEASNVNVSHRSGALAGWSEYLTRDQGVRHIGEARLPLSYYTQEEVYNACNNDG